MEEAEGGDSKLVRTHVFWPSQTDRRRSSVGKRELVTKGLKGGQIFRFKSDSGKYVIFFTKLTRT